MLCFSMTMPFKHKKFLISKTQDYILHIHNDNCAVVDECTEPNNRDGWRVYLLCHSETEVFI